MEIVKAKCHDSHCEVERGDEFDIILGGFYVYWKPAKNDWVGYCMTCGKELYRTKNKLKLGASFTAIIGNSKKGKRLSKKLNFK